MADRLRPVLVEVMGVDDEIGVTKGFDTMVGGLHRQRGE